MSDDIVIRAENVSKRYRISHLAEQHTLRDAMHHAARLAWRRVRWNTRLRKDDFWALRNVDFEIKRGEVVGIIGRNGAGKSTLLKVLSRISEPTTGRISLKGRVASLLEVGTGFHPELTGRDNIYLNGAILGMSRAEIRRNFDEIVAFAEVERFLDTPVKRYSSGMYVRLAFSVAAHLQPEILIVDEVLAVGDAEFQKKCMGKMQHVSRSGRTVLFVSHNMNAVTSLCSSAIVLKQGTIAYQGDVRQALAHYGASSQVDGRFEFTGKKTPPVLNALEIFQKGAPTRGLLEPDVETTIEFTVESTRRLGAPRVGVAFTNTKGDRVFAVASWLAPVEMAPLEPGRHVVCITFTMPPLVPGRYTMDTGFYDSVADITEEQNFVGPVEMLETNYLNTMAPTIAEIGQIYVRSKTECR